MTTGAPDFILITEVDDWRIARPIFQRKFKADPPDVPHHIVSFYRAPDGALWPASYVHYRPVGDIDLVGGASTDGDVLRRMSDAERTAVQTSGGLYLQALRWAFARYANRCDAYFGYCGDARAWDVDMAAGFVPTEHDKLIARWHKPLPENVRRALVAKAHALGPF